MPNVTISEAHSNLNRLIDESVETHQPILITGKRNNAILVSEDDWSAIQESIHLLSIAGMRESIREGMVEPINECTYKLDW